MPQYKLIYFNGRGLAELSRLIFAYAGVEFEDFRMKDREDFLTNFKPVLPTGRVPVLEVDGKQYAESAAIARYLAREFKLYGKDNLEALQIDGILDTMNDIRMALMPIFREQDEAKKAELKKKAVEESIPAVMAILEKLVGDVFVGNSITLADIAFFRTMEITLAQAGNILENYPKLKALNEKMGTEPKIAAWVAKRPETPF
ncbi:S-crystallin SL11-like [Amphiura filiformis]|uniref:S-crystallin SL11-like n=1 Tax=Amphiura filiformis TaxID=82378 RepID=UPI003B219644